MVQFLTLVTIGMVAALTTLVATIVIGRLISDRSRRRERALRPVIESAIADYLAAEDPQPLPFPPGRRWQEVVRKVALEAMAELRGRERDRLVVLLEQTGIVAETAAGLGSRRRRVRRASAEVLRQIGSEEAVRPLLAGLDDSDLDTGLSCGSALADLSASAPIPPVLALADRGAVARPGAVVTILVTLGRRHPTTIGDALAPEASLELRRLAAAVAGELRLAEHVPRLREALASEDDELVARAARGLGMIGDDDAVDRLLGLVESGDRAWFVRVAATGALGAIGDPRAVPPLERELGSDGWLLQAKAAEALRMLGAAGEQALRRGLGSQVEAVRDHSRVALER